MNAKFLLVALVLGACDDTDTNTNDTGDTTPEMFEASFTAGLNQYGWEGDEVVLLGSSDKSADYLASNGEETVSGTTPDTVELSSGIWSSSYFYDESTMLYLGWASADLSTTSNLGATLCADLSGDWSCDDGNHPDPFITEDVAMNGCSIQLNGITGFGSDWLAIDGNKVYLTFNEGSTIRGIVSSNSIDTIVNRSDGYTYEFRCDRI